MSTKTQIAGVELDSYVFNASGPKDVTFDELEIIAKSASAAVTIKTCTVEPRKGNEEPRYAEVPLGSINSMGYPNLGYREYVKMIPHLKKLGKPVIASVGVLHMSEFPTLIQAFNDTDIDFLELNFSCPNLSGKPQIGYDFEMTDTLLKELVPLIKKPFGIKIPPYFDPVHWEMAANVFRKYPIGALVCINSIGNTLIVDAETEQPLIKPKGGFGGLGGDFVKPVALANVRALSQLLGDRMSIVGVGGIKSGADAFEFLLCGADAVQVGTVFMKEGPECFGRIDRELAAIMAKKEYPDIASVKGKLKIL